MVYRRFPDTDFARVIRSGGKVAYIVSRDLPILTLIASFSGGKSSKECIERSPDMDCAGSSYLLFSILLLNPFQRPFQIWYFLVPGSQFHSRSLVTHVSGDLPIQTLPALNFGFFISIAPAVSALLSTTSTFTVPQSPLRIQVVGTFVSGDLPYLLWKRHSLEAK